nr:MAG TPA: hypothetical protein [Caudoviricetes sp.]
MCSQAKEIGPSGSKCVPILDNSVPILDKTAVLFKMRTDPP